VPAKRKVKQKKGESLIQLRLSNKKKKRVTIRLRAERALTQNRIASIQATPICEIPEPAEHADKASHGNSVDEHLWVILHTQQHVQLRIRGPGLSSCPKRGRGGSAFRGTRETREGSRKGERAIGGGISRHQVHALAGERVKGRVGERASYRTPVVCGRLVCKCF
jgi:hypothetical protein